MDNNYIKLCAEMAYNDVIIESVLNEEVLNEDTSNIKERIKGFFDKIIKFIKNLTQKITNFIKDKIKELKAKLEEIKKKREEKKKEAKQESASLYNQLMKMVLTTEATNYDKLIDDFIINLFDKHLLDSESNLNKEFNKYIMQIKNADSEEKISNIIKELNINFENIQKKCEPSKIEEFFNIMLKNYTSLDSKDHFPSTGLISAANRLLVVHQENSQRDIDNIKDNADNIIKSYIEKEENDKLYDQKVNAYKNMFTSYTKALSTINNSYAKMSILLLRIPAITASN